MGAVISLVARSGWIARLLWFLALTAAFLAPPLVAGAIGISQTYKHDRMPAFRTPGSMTRPEYSPEKKTALVVSGVEGSESSDLLGPYQLLAESGAFNVFTVAPERTLTPLFPASPYLAGVDMIPHYSFAEFEREIGVVPDLIVVPYIPGTDRPADRPILEWLRTSAGPDTIVLSICGGAKAVADAGLLSGLTSTTHRNIFAQIEPFHPDVTMVRGVRWVESGNVISSAGITSGVDATLRAIERLEGRDLALETAEKVAYPYVSYLDEQAFEAPERATFIPQLRAAYGWSRSTIGLVLFDGVDELALAAITDTYPRSMEARIHTVAAERDIVYSRNGLALVPRSSFDSSPVFDRVIVPGATVPGDVLEAVDRWAGESGQSVMELIHADSAGSYVFDSTLIDMSQQHGQVFAKLAAAGLEYPIDHLRLEGRRWPVELLIRPMLLGLGGVALLHGIRRWTPRFRRRDSVLEHAENSLPRFAS